MESIEVVTEGNKTTITFKGNHIDREDFMDEARGFTHSFLRKQLDNPPSSAFDWIFREMIKNLYDHGTGKGTLVMINTDDYFEFQFIDGNPTKIDFNEISNRENWVKKTDKNFNIGLKGMFDVAETYNLNLVVDDSKGGIHYSGKYSKPKAPPE